MVKYFSTRPIEISLTASNVNKDRPLHLNSRRANVAGTTNHVATIASQDVSLVNNSYTVAIGARGVTFSNGVSDVVHLGRGYNKTNWESNQVVAGGSLAVRGVDDDGSTQYRRSDWITSQAKLRTSRKRPNRRAFAGYRCFRCTVIWIG